MGMEHKRHPWFIPEWLVGAKALGYKLEKFLGAGGFGAVYLTTTPQGEARAVKVLYPPHSRNAEDLRDWQSRASRFLRELLTTAQFNHPNIVRIYDTGMLQWHYEAPEGPSALDGDYLLPFYVADYLPDGVEQRLTNAEALTSDEVVEIGRQILEGLTALHSCQPPVLHLDLNPANIRLAEGRRAVITDFGVARIQGVTRPSSEEFLSRVLVGHRPHRRPSKSASPALSPRKGGLRRRGQTLTPLPGRIRAFNSTASPSLSRRYGRREITGAPALW